MRLSNPSLEGRIAVRRAFTLIELLIVIAIIALLISILLPALQSAREESKRMVCMANMRSIGIGVNGYLGNDGQGNLPWTYVYGISTTNPTTYLRYPGSEDGEFGIARNSSSYTWGGMVSPRPTTSDAIGGLDYTVVPAELRPLNRYLDDGATGRAPVKVTQCPGDRSSFSPTVGENQVPLQIEGAQPSWETFGNSYSINWFFMEEPDLTGWGLFDLFEHGKKAIKLNAGSRAAEWVIMWENQADQLFVGSTIQGGTGRDGPGWHKRYSFHTFMFLDGHVEHRLFNTRNVKGPGWRVFRKWTLITEPPFE